MESQSVQCVNLLYKITVLQNTEYKLRIVEHG